jgi:hypothetical protein
VVLVTTSEGVAASSLLVDFGEIPLVVPVPSLEKEPAWTLSVSPLQPRAPPASLLPLLSTRKPAAPAAAGSRQSPRRRSEGFFFAVFSAGVMERPPAAEYPRTSCLSYCVDASVNVTRS